MIRRFARPYARAILDVTQTPDRAKALRDELQSFENARAGSPDLAAMFANPGIESGAKLGIAATIAKRLGLSDLAGKVIEVLIANRRINDLGAIVDALSEMIRQETNTVLAVVTAAHPPTDAERDELQHALEGRFGRSVEVRVSVDPSLIGGFVARVGSEVYDASVAGKIEQFRSSLI
jgi:F-type H+-transporting ATPase subunit delta